MWMIKKKKYPLSMQSLYLQYQYTKWIRENGEGNRQELNLQPPINLIRPPLHLSVIAIIILAHRYAGCATHSKTTQWREFQLATISLGLIPKSDS